LESSVWVSFGQWLREERLKQRLSVEEAAARAGYSRQQWDKLEKGQTGTKRERIPLIALAIGKPPDEALRRAGFAAEETLSPCEEVDLLLRQMPAERLPIAVALLRFNPHPARRPGATSEGAGRFMHIVHVSILTRPEDRVRRYLGYFSNPA
jgi:transcriptional regulator with XRE-family HTH domain